MLCKKRKGVVEALYIFTTLLLGRSRSGASFQDVFSISLALSLGVVLQLTTLLQEEVRRGRKEHKAETR